MNRLTGGKNMRTKRDKRKIQYFMLALGAFILPLHWGTGAALAITETDMDGFSETGTSTLPPNTYLTLTDGSGNTPQITTLPKCTGTQTGVAREKCLDPATKDLFVIIQRASLGSKISSPGYSATNPDPLALVRNGGLGVTIHELRQTVEGSQAITESDNNTYYAVKINEITTTEGYYLGYSTFATFPSGYTGGTGKVWTQKITDWIDKTCGKTAPVVINGISYSPSVAKPIKCVNTNSGTTITLTDPTANLSQLYKEYIQNIVSHEASHLIHLAADTNTTDHHYTTISGTLMEQNIQPKQTVDKSGNVVVSLPISTTFQRNDKTQFQLRPLQ
jgi:hypothetical protein